MSGAPVIFQDVVPFFSLREHSSRRLGAKVQISRINLPGAPLIRGFRMSGILGSQRRVCPITDRACLTD
jgi:hypothetical protein